MTSTAIVSLLLATSAVGASAAEPAPAPIRAVHPVANIATLEVKAVSQTMIWNAVAVDGARVFVAGPRWTGSRGPSLAVLDAGGAPQPYPDPAWNSWRPGADNATAFVNVNAIHLDGKGNLWVVDSGSPDFGGNPLPHGAKVIQIDLASNRVRRVIELDSTVALPGSYVDDIRFHGQHAYLTDAGRPGLIVLDLDSGHGRRVLQDAASTTASADRLINVAGTVVRTGNGQPLRVNADPFEISPDGKHLYFGPLSGPWSQIETRWLDDANVSPATLAQAVQPWADLPPVGGTTMDAAGNLYFTDLKTNSLQLRRTDGTISTVLQDDRLHWVDAPFIDARNGIWLPVPQMDRGPLFNGGTSRIAWPISLYRLQLQAGAK